MNENYRFRLAILVITILLSLITAFSLWSEQGTDGEISRRSVEIPAGFDGNQIVVLEGLSPIWVDLDGDGRREIIVTISDARLGARLVVFDEQGNRIASGPAIGQSHRWRHQLAVAPYGSGLQSRTIKDPPRVDNDHHHRELSALTWAAGFRRNPGL